MPALKTAHELARRRSGFHDVGTQFIASFSGLKFKESSRKSMSTVKVKVGTHRMRPSQAAPPKAISQELSAAKV